MQVLRPTLSAINYWLCFQGAFLCANGGIASISICGGCGTPSLLLMKFARFTCIFFPLFHYAANTVRWRLLG